MSRSRVALAAYLAASLAVVPFVMAGPGAGSLVPGAVAGLTEDGHQRDLTSGVSNASTTFCLVEKYDLTLTNVTMEVRHQEGTPFRAENLTMDSHMPTGDPDDPLVFENERVEMDKLCSTLSLEHAPIEVIMTDATVYDLTISGRSVEQHFDRGTSEKLVLYVTLESGLKLLPKILTAAHNSSAVSTSSWRTAWDAGNRTNATAGASDVESADPRDRIETNHPVDRGYLVAGDRTPA